MTRNAFANQVFGVIIVVVLAAGGLGMLASAGGAAGVSSEPAAQSSGPAWAVAAIALGVLLGLGAAFAMFLKLVGGGSDAEHLAGYGLAPDDAPVAYGGAWWHTPLILLLGVMGGLLALIGGRSGGLAFALGG